MKKATLYIVLVWVSCGKIWINLARISYNLCYNYCQQVLGLGKKSCLLVYFRPQSVKLLSVHWHNILAPLIRPNKFVSNLMFLSLGIEFVRYKVGLLLHFIHKVEAVGYTSTNEVSGLTKPQTCFRFFT